jgi:hypothetical protein
MVLISNTHGHKPKLCSCGSGLEREAQFDGYNIFLCYTCPQCEAEQMKRWRSDIKEQYFADEPIEED